MKPRPMPCRPTEEDFATMTHMYTRLWRKWNVWGVPLMSWFWMSDRRDADIMLEAQSQRWCEIRLTDDLVFADRARFPIPYLAPIGQPCGPVGGDITSFA